MDAIVRRIREKVELTYLATPFYSGTIWTHVLHVAEFAKQFARHLQANEFVSEVGGLLHDLGAAVHGKPNHHVTGMQQALPVLLDCECPFEFIWPILMTIHAHRGSTQFAFDTPEQACVAAADSCQHFENVQVLWNVCKMNWHIAEENIYDRLRKKLENDWRKIHPRLRPLLSEDYRKALGELSAIARRENPLVGKMQS